MLADLHRIEAGIEQGFLSRAETLLDWVEEQEMAPFADLSSEELGTDTDPFAEAEAEEFLGRARTGGALEGPPVGRPVAIAGEGAPMVSDLALVDLAAALGRSVVSATRLVGGVCELAYRLPKVWARIRDRKVALWRGLRLAQKTIHLSSAAAEEVDAELAGAIGSCSWAQIDRCVQAAIERHTPDPEEADPDSEDAVDQDEQPDQGRVAEDRCFDVHLREAGNSDHLFTSGSGIGLIGADGILEAADALDLDHAIGDLAQQLADAGSTEPLGARRAKALGMLARGEVPLTTTEAPTTEADSGVGAGAAGSAEADRCATGSSTAGSGAAFGLAGSPAAGAPAGQTGTTPPRQTGTTPPRQIGIMPAVPGSRRQVLLVLHLSENSILGQDRVGRCQNTLAPASIDQIKAWCAGATVKVQPVLDIADHHPVGTYEIPDRIRAQVTYRDPECVFPYCHTPARACDADHIDPWPQGPTCACNLAPLCRRHHRAKTARRWTYVMIHPGSYYWRAPSGATYLVDAHGTHQLPDLTHPGATHHYRQPCPSETDQPAVRRTEAPVRELRAWRRGKRRARPSGRRRSPTAGRPSGGRSGPTAGRPSGGRSGPTAGLSPPDPDPPPRPERPPPF